MSCCAGPQLERIPQAAAQMTAPAAVIEVARNEAPTTGAVEPQLAPTAHAARLHDLGRYTLFDSLLI